MRAVIELFTNQLAKVSFPDIDAAALRRQAEDLRTQSKEVARIRESLDAALAGFVTRLATLTETAMRAVAYARIYSVAHPDQHALATAIAALSEPAEISGASVTSGSKRRSRPSRRSADLFENATIPRHDEPV
ncbi:MAG TPA: hypothetical protein VHN14_36975 [Kofleriaceae bacterium]|nr:hypothetical protein [Kofleriaceae bacterium]